LFFVVAEINKFRKTLFSGTCKFYWLPKVSLKKRSCSQ